MKLERVTGIRVRVLMLPGFGGWVAGAAIAWFIAVKAGEALRGWLW